MSAPFLDRTLLDAGLQHDPVIAHVDAFEDFASRAELLRIQVDEIAARTARLKRLVAPDGLDLVAPPPPESIH